MAKANSDAGLDRPTPVLKRKRYNIFPPEEIAKAGGLEAYVKKIGYNSSKIDLSLHDKFTKKELRDILNYD